MPVNPNDPRAPYLQIADELRQAITSGRLAPGERLESGRKLAQRHGVAPMTVQQALRELRSQGLIVTWQGRGAYVSGGDADPEAAGDKGVAAIIDQLDALADTVSDLEARVARLEKTAGRTPARQRDR